MNGYRHLDLCTSTAGNLMCKRKENTMYSVIFITSSSLYVGFSSRHLNYICP